MSLEKKSSAVDLQPRGKFSPIFILVQVIFSIAIVMRISAAEAYAAYSAPLQLFVYLAIFNTIGILFYDRVVPFLKDKTRLVFYWVLAVLAFYIYVISFYPVLEFNGDNAAYLARAKSLMEGNGFRNIWMPGEPYDTSLKGIGFSILNIPFIAIFGMNNFIGIQILPFLATFAGLFFMYRYFEDKLDKAMLFLLLVVVGFYSQIVHFASITMTESVSFFLLFLILFLTERKVAIDGPFTLKRIGWCVLIGVIIFITFTVREALIVLCAGIPLFLLLRKKWKDAILVGTVIAILFSGYFAYSAHLKELNLKLAPVQTVAQSSAPEKSFVQQYWTSLKGTIKVLTPGAFGKASLVISQKLLGDPDRSDYATTGTNVFILLILGLGIFFRIRSKKPLAGYEVFALILIPLVVVFWGTPVDVVVFSRYFYPLIALIFFYYFSALTGIAQLIIKNEKIRTALVFGIVSITLVFAFSMNTMAVYIAKNPYQPAERNFITACEWIRANTPKASLIANRKSGLAYIWADRKSLHYFNTEKYSRYDSYSPEFEKDTMDYYARMGIDFVILDAFSQDAFYKILPVIKNNANRFQVVYATAQPQTYVLKVKKR